MSKILDFFKKINIVYLYLIILLLIIGVIAMTTLFMTKKKVVTKTIKLVSEKKEEVKTTIKVDIKGNVVNPGVYETDDGSRVIDVINMAGGLKEDSNTELINLSLKLKDEMTIIIYTNKEIEEYIKNKNQPKVTYIEVEKCPDNINDACINKNNTNKKNTNSNESNSPNDNKLISINEATLEELQTLTGVGESKAKAIIEYRETNGKYNSIEDIKNVNGIGESLFEKIKDSITV